MKNHHYFILGVLGLLLLTSNSFAEEAKDANGCPINVRGTNNGWYTVEIFYYDCHEKAQTIWLTQGRSIQLGSLEGPRGGVRFDAYPKARPPETRRTQLGWITVPPGGTTFECKGTSPAFQGGTGRCDKK